MYQVTIKKIEEKDGLKEIYTEVEKDKYKYVSTPCKEQVQTVVYTQNFETLEVTGLVAWLNK